MEVAESTLWRRGFGAAFAGIFRPSATTFVAPVEGRGVRQQAQGAEVVQDLWRTVEGVENGLQKLATEEVVKTRVFPIGDMGEERPGVFESSLRVDFVEDDSSAYGVSERIGVDPSKPFFQLLLGLEP